MHVKPKTKILLSLTLLFWALTQVVAQQDKLKDIVLLNSYHSTFKWTADITEGVLQEFSDPSKYRVFVEYMDSKRFQSEAYIENLSRIYTHKYSPSSIDGVILSDNNAFDFFLKYGDDIWGNVPVAFCGNNNIHDYDFDTTRFKGIDEQINIDSTLQIIKALQPGLEELIVISDSTISGVIFSNQFLKAVHSRHPELNYELLYADSPGQLKTALRDICPGKKAIYLLSLYIDREGFSREIIQEARLVLDNCPVPVYSNWDFLFGDFITGGIVIRGSDQGREAAKIMKELLNKTIHRPWLTPTKEMLAFDYRQLNKNGISIESPIIKKATLLNKPENPLARFKQELIIVFSILLFLIIVILVLLRVLSQKQKAEKRLIQSESRLEMALEGANEGLWDVDFKTGNIFLSQKFATLLKYNNPNEIHLHASNHSNFFHKSDLPQLSEAYQMYKAGRTPLFQCEVRIQAKTHQYIWFSVHGKIIETDLNHEPVRMVGTINEIQSQKEFEHQLKAAKDRAEESDRLKSAFLANMSHEIRTPMNAILGFTDLIMTNLIEKHEKNKYLGMIKSSGENLLNIINDIIDISKIESGQLKIYKEQFDLNNLFEDLKMVSQSLILQKEKDLIVNIQRCSEDSHFFIYADPYRLQQILLNLLTNAIKFTEKGSIEIGCKIKDQKTLVFFVKDTGYGIAPEHKSIIFERFRQADETSIRKFGGTGLGLAITKSLVSMMKGEIWFSSEQGVGSEFSFTLPCEFNTLKAGVHF